MNYNETNEILRQIHDFEKEINFNDKFNVVWADIINYFILSEHYGLATFSLKFIKTLRNFTWLRKLSRNMN